MTDKLITVLRRIAFKRPRPDDSSPPVEIRLFWEGEWVLYERSDEE